MLKGMKDAPPRLRLKTPEDVLGATPYLLGFHPTDSAVLLGVNGARLVFHVRADLPAADASDAEVELVARELAELMAEQGVTAVVFIGYGPEPRVTRAVQAIDDALGDRRIVVRDLLRATDGRYWSYTCQDPTCCPPEGTPFDPAVTAVAAAATVAGCVALPDREAVVRSLDPPVNFALVAIVQATDRALTRMAELFDGPAAARPDQVPVVLRAGEAALDEAYACYDGFGRLEDDDVAWLTVLLQTIEVRDCAWARIDADGRSRWPMHERVWTDVVRRCEPAFAAPPAMLLAYTLWRTGDGVRANVAVDRALAADPSYSAANIMAGVLERGIPPSAVRRMRARGRRRSARRG
jgi:hypothetical protein